MIPAFLTSVSVNFSLWEYIRKHDLQDPKDKRNVRADENLLAVFDGKKVISMFEMTKLVNGHIV